MRNLFVGVSLTLLVVIAALSFFVPGALWSLVVIGPLVLLGFYDMAQTRHAVRRNFPLLGHFRYLFESIRPEISQYFIETDTNGVPFNREHRSIVYQRSKDTLDTVPFGTIRNVYEVGYEWVDHSLAPASEHHRDLRVRIGGARCTQPYDASILNVSAMSYGSLSKEAVRALNEGARMGGFAHNTGEGGLSPYHLDGGGDLIWQIGTGYFGCRNSDGTFSAELYAEKAKHPHVKMIELKLSQGAKPGHGGILPAAKVTEEISKIRHVEMGKDVLSPPAHSAFSTPVGLLEFIDKLRELSGGKPVGFKLCVGRKSEFLAICKAMRATGITPDFIAVDGGEGGTGAAPLEFTNRIGSPLMEGLIFVHNSLVGFSLRDEIRIIASGKVITGYDIVKRIALGADLVASARGMMLSLGCIQARRCNSNHCPVGVATQDSQLRAGLVVADKNKRVANYHKETVMSVCEIMGAMGIEDTADLQPEHINRRISATETKNYGELYDYLKGGELLSDVLPEAFAKNLMSASMESFGRGEQEKALH